MDFKARADNQQLLKSLSGELYARADALLKYEYSIMLERGKHDIVKEYFDSELSKIE